jgi:O-antigen ligase
MGFLRPIPSPPWPPRDERSGARLLLEHARRRDPIGHAVHLGASLAAIFLLPLATGYKDVAFLVLCAVALLRLYATLAPCGYLLLHDRLLWLAAAWAAWRALSIAWSGDPAMGLEEVRALRVLALPLMLWPVLVHPAWLLAALACGVLAQNLVQLMQGLGAFGLEPGANQRLHGLIHPIATGTFCALAACWHLSIVLRARGRIVPLAGAALAVALAGLVFSGSRGPWLGAAVALPSLLIAGIVSRPTRRRAAWLLAAGVVGAAVLAPAAAPLVATRARAAWEDLQSFRRGENDLRRDVRLILWTSAWRIFLEHPVHGVGAGGFSQAVHRHHPAVEQEWAHAHSVPLHELSTVGAVGAGLFAVVLGGVMRRAWRARATAPWAWGTAAALVAWAVGSVFDSHHLNGHMLGVFAFIATLATPLAPSPGGADRLNSP